VYIAAPFGNVTIKRPNGTYEKYNAKGEFLSDEEPNEWYLFNDGTTKIYDKNGNVLYEKDDFYNRETKRFYRNEDGSIKSYEEYEYDENGNNSRIVFRNADDSIDCYEEYEYDENGNNSRTVVRNADDSINYYCEYEYDENGKCTKTIKKNADGSVIE
jgi:hypothetical protein